MESLRKRLTYANVISTIALFLVLAGGSAVAAKQLAKNSVGPNQIKKNAVTTAKVKNKAITGAKIKLGTLGAVPKAKSLTYSRKPKLVKTPVSASAATTAAALAAASPVELYQDSNFRIYGKCFLNTGTSEVNAVVLIATKQDGAVFDSNEDELNGTAPDGYLNIATPESDRYLQDVFAGVDSADVRFEGDTEFGAVAANGAAILGDIGIGVKQGNLAAGDGPYGAGSSCMFVSTVTRS